MLVVSKRQPNIRAIRPHQVANVVLLGPVRRDLDKCQDVRVRHVRSEPKLVLCHHERVSSLDSALDLDEERLTGGRVERMS